MKVNIKKIFRIHKNLIKEGRSIKDKFILILRLLVLPIKILNNNFDHNIGNVFLENEMGIFYCSHAYIASSIYEEKIKKYLHCKGTFIDVGAHIGKYTISVAKRCKNVISIEPTKRNLKFLLKNIKINDLENVTIIPKACSDRNGISKLYLGSSCLTHSLTKEKKRDFIKIKTTTLDNIYKKYDLKNVDLIKIDVEGAEPNVLKGGKNLLRNESPRIIFEALDDESLKKIKKMLQKQGYSYFEKIDKRNYLALPSKNDQEP